MIAAVRRPPEERLRRRGAGPAAPGRRGHPPQRGSGAIRRPHADHRSRQDSRPDRQLRSAGITLAYDPETRTLRSGDSRIGAVALGPDRLHRNSSTRKEEEETPKTLANHGPGRHVRRPRHRAFPDQIAQVRRRRRGLRYTYAASRRDENGNGNAAVKHDGQLATRGHGSDSL